MESEYRKSLLEAALETQENERKRIALDLHDGVGALLSTIKLYASHLPATLPTKEPNPIVDKMLGKNKKGGIGLYVDIGTIGYFRDLKITKREFKVKAKSGEKINGI